MSAPVRRRVVAAAVAVPVVLGTGLALAGAQASTTAGKRPAARAGQAVPAAGSPVASRATKHRKHAAKAPKKSTRRRGAAGTVVTAGAADLVVDAAKPGGVVKPGVFGGNMVGSENVTLPGFGPAMRGLGMRLLRWPGGNLSDGYHWKTNTTCSGSGFMSPGSTFDNFLKFRSEMGSPTPDVNITVNYGSNAACNGGGDPAEAAAWVDYANNVKKAGIRYWSIGNEQMWGNFDLHAKKNDPHTYAAAVKEYSRLMKAADPSIKIGIDVAGKYQTGWDDTVLREAKGSYDFVEIHWYAPALSDANLLGHEDGQGPAFWAEDLAVLKRELAAAGVDMPVYLGEWGPTPDGDNRKTTSIYGGLFTAQMLGDLVTQGVDQATYFMGIGFCDKGSDAPAGVHAPLALTSFGLQSNGLPSCQTAGKTIPVGTPFPSGRAFQLWDLVTDPGQRVLPATGTLPAGVRAYAVTRADGYGVVLVNTSPSASRTVTLRVDGAGAGTYRGSTWSYDVTRADAMASGSFPGFATATPAVTGTTVTVQLAPLSMTGVALTRS